MSNTFQQYKISDMIKALKKQKKEQGDLLVEMSIDEEGNGFHPIGDYILENKKETLLPFSTEDGKLTIFPCE